MADDVEWITYAALAERLGLPTATAAAARARRSGWPRRTRNDAKRTAEVAVPRAVLAIGKPPADVPPLPAPEPPALDVLRDQLVALQAMLARETTDRRTLQSQSDALRDRVAALEAEAADATATARAERDRRIAAEEAVERLQQAQQAERDAQQRRWWRRIF